MASLHHTVLETFQAMQWEYRLVPGMEVIEADFESHHTKVSLHVQSYGDTGILSVVSMASHLAPQTHFPAVAELLMRANHELNIGNFELDWDNGQVMFRVTNIFPEGGAEQSIISSLVHSAVLEMDRLTPFLAETCRTSAEDLAGLSIPDLLRRPDLQTLPGDSDIDR